MRLPLIGAALCAVPLSAYAQTAPTQSYDGNQSKVPSVSIMCPTSSANGAPVGPCTFGAGSGTVSTVNQGAAGTSPWVFSLPSGAATAALQNTINTTLGSPFQTGGSIGNTAFGISGSLPAGTNALGSVSVSNLPATQAVSAATLPLPNGAATAANQTPPAAAGTSAASAMPVQGTAGGVPFSTTSYSGTASACSASTVGTSATLILDTAANAGRAAGGLVLPSTATAPVEYEWVTGGAGLTTTPGGLVFQVTPGGSISFAGAPSAQLYAISTSSQAVSCMAVK